MSEGSGDGSKSISSTSFPNFCLKNQYGYPTWKFKMRNYLIHEDLWQAVSGYPDGDQTPASVKARIDSKALTKICLTVDGEAITHVRCAKTATEAWVSLQNIYEDKGMGRRLSLERKLYRMSLADFDNLESYINAVLSTAQDLADIDKVIDDSSVAAILLGGLTPKYEPMIMALENCNVTVTTAMVKTKLINEMSKMASSNDTVLQTQVKYIEQGKPVVCHDCKVPGHKRPQCPLRKKKNSNTEGQIKDDFASFTALNTSGGSSNVWYVDSGASKHMTSRQDWFGKISLFDNGKVTVANGEQVKCCGVGNISITTPKDVVNTISDVALVPQLKANLLSVQKIVDKGFICVFDKSGCNFYKNDGTFGVAGDSVLHASPCGGLYVLDCTVNISQHVDNSCIANNMHSDCLNRYQLWHKRLGHLCCKSMNKLKNHGVSVDFTKAEKSSCIACIEGKQARKPFKRLAPYVKATSPLQLVHSDLCGPMPTTSFQGNKYVLTFIDDFTRLVFVYFIQSKCEVKNKFIIFQALVENQLGTRIKTIRTDGGSEYVNKEFADYLSSKGVEHQTTAPYSPQQNGVAERTNRTMTEIARSMMAESSLPKAYWEDAFQAAVYLKNRVPHRYLNGQVPLDKWSGRKNDLRHLKVFGCRALVHIPECQRKKLDLKAEEAVFVGYSENPNVYIFRDPSNPRRILRSRDATFFENTFTRLKGNDSEPQVESSPMLLFDNNIVNDEEFFDCADSPNSDTEPSTSAYPECIDVDTLRDADHPCTPVNTEGVEESSELEVPQIEEPRYPSRNRKPPDFLTYFIDSDEPSSYHKAINSEDAHNWVSAMTDEHNSLLKLHTWELVSRPNHKKVIPCKWVYRVKKDAYGNFTKYKARLVVKGFKQAKGVDYYETFAPVIRHSSLRTLFALAAEMGLKMKHIDVDTAFLNGDLHEEVFMEQPPGFVEKGHEDKVCLLRKSLYGLKQAPREWNKKLDETLNKIGFKSTPSEPCVYVKLFEQELVILGVYVDDIIVYYKTDLTFDIVKNDLQRFFSLKDLGYLKSYLGLQISCSEDSVEVSQSNYILSVLEKFNMLDCKSASTPLAQKKLDRAPSGESALPYQSLIGCLMFLAVNSRPDIAYAVSYLSQFNTCYAKEHWQAAKRILQYLKGTIDYSIIFRKSGKPLVGFSDADWANCPIDRKSYTGYVFMLAGGPVAWEAKKQPTVALSSTEAEYMALTAASKEACYLQRFISEITGKLYSIKILSDSQSALNLVNNPVHHNRTKHIDTRFHFIREKVSDNVIVLDFLRGNDMPADILTKPLGSITHNKCVTNIGLAK